MRDRSIFSSEFSMYNNVDLRIRVANLVVNLKRKTSWYIGTLRARWNMDRFSAKFGEGKSLLSLYRAVRRSENQGGHIVLGGDNVPTPLPACKLPAIYSDGTDFKGNAHIAFPFF